MSFGCQATPRGPVPVAGTARPRSGRRTAWRSDSRTLWGRRTAAVAQSGDRPSAGPANAPGTDGAASGARNTLPVGGLIPVQADIKGRLDRARRPRNVEQEPVGMGPRHGQPLGAGEGGHGGVVGLGRAEPCGELLPGSEVMAVGRVGRVIQVGGAGPGRAAWFRSGRVSARADRRAFPASRPSGPGGGHGGGGVPRDRHPRRRVRGGLRPLRRDRLNQELYRGRTQRNRVLVNVIRTTFPVTGCLSDHPLSELFPLYAGNAAD